MRNIMTALLVLVSIVSYSQKQDQIYTAGVMREGQILDPFSLLSTAFEFKPLSSAQEQMAAVDVDSIFKAGHWIYRIQVDAKAKLATRIFHGQFDIYKSYDKAGSTQHFLSTSEGFFALTDQNMNQVFSEFVKNFHADIPSRTDAILVRAAKTYHEKNHLKVRDAWKKQRNSAISIGMGGELIHSFMDRDDLFADYSADPRWKILLSFNLKRSRININYSFGGTMFSTFPVSDGLAVVNLENMRIETNGFEVQYDYFLTKAKVSPFLRLGVLLTNPTWSDDLTDLGFKYNDRAHPIFGAGINVFQKPSIDISYSYRHKFGDVYLHQSNFPFVEKNHIFSVEIRFN
jgi:hypothetical protein